MNRNLLGKGWAFPVTSDVSGNIEFSKYEKSIEESIRIILGTTPGERLMRPDFGCSVTGYQFILCITTTYIISPTICLPSL
jgi:phage baseplate assembly protein W